LHLQLRGSPCINISRYSNPLASQHGMSGSCLLNDTLGEARRTRRWGGTNSTTRPDMVKELRGGDVWLQFWPKDKDCNLGHHLHAEERRKET